MKKCKLKIFRCEWIIFWALYQWFSFCNHINSMWNNSIRIDSCLIIPCTVNWILWSVNYLKVQTEMEVLHLLLLSIEYIFQDYNPYYGNIDSCELEGKIIINSWFEWTITISHDFVLIMYPWSTKIISPKITWWMIISLKDVSGEYVHKTK
jgi:hypothetical protein